MRSAVLALILAAAAIPALAQPGGAQSDVVQPAAAPPADGPSRIFRPQDLFSLEYASDPQFRRDGAEIAYVRNTEDIMSDNERHAIWLVDARTGAERPLGATAAGGLSPRWSPDGKRLAYVAADEGRPQLFVRWMDTGAVAKVADLPAAPNDVAWSPDGRTIAFTMLVDGEAPTLGAPLDRPDGAKWAKPLQIIDSVTYRADGAGYLKPGYTHLFVVSADGGTPRQLTYGAFNDGGPLSWSPDGRTILLSAGRGKDWRLKSLNSEIYAVDAVDGAMTALTHHVGPAGEAVISPDGRHIAYVGFDDQFKGYQNVRLYVMGADGKNDHVVTAGFDNSVDDPEWAADGKSLFVSYVDHGVSRIARVGLDGHMTTLAEGMNGAEMDRPYTGGEYSVAADGAVAFTQGAPDEPGDIAVARGGQTRRLTHLNADLFEGKTLAKVQPLAVVSSYDKRPIDAWVMTPPGFDPSRKYPLILEIHGGPFAAYGPVFASELQLYASAGYIVVYANPRGSTSYGDAFANLIDKNYPSQDYDDLMSAVDAVVAKGWADPNNLFVTGGSGGGALTAWIVGKTGRFKAAVAQKPVINWTSEVLTTDGYNQMAKYWFGKMPWEDHEAYWKRSPLSLVGNVTTPTMLMVGEDDHRTPGSEAEQFYDALQLRGVPTTLIRVPGASHHGLADRPSQEAEEANAILAWFARYRTPAATTVASR